MMRVDRRNRNWWRAAAGVGTAALMLAVGVQSGGQPDRPPAPKDAGRVLTPAKTPDAAAGDPQSFIRFGAPRPIAKPDGALRVAVYNVENLFDDFDDPSLSGDNEDKDNLKPDAHCKAVAEAIRAIDADIVGLTEIESKQALEWFLAKYLPDSPYKHIESIDAGDDRGIEQAVISKYPVVEAKNWPRLPLGGMQPEKWGNSANRDAGKPLTFHRSPLCVTIEVPTKTEDPAAKPYVLTMFVVHQKSGGPGGYWREKEATKTVELIKEIQSSDPNRNIIVMGDMNARPEEKPIKIYTDPAQGGMIDVFAPVRKRRDPLYVTHESGRAIDFILLNPAAEKELIPETRFILGTPARPAGVDWRTTPGPAGYAADHYPVVIDLVPRDR